MKIILFSLVLVILTASSEQAIYNMMHERERQQCLQQGKSDCPRTDSYKKYKKQRDEVMQNEDINQ